ncbi:gastrula zinc finger protein xFG20-1-like isoform X2 [Lutzomyia longipalpis]|uniref:gastrula zinc finger protein xFG20-1-like isoform X2 n=1 Tax=Lutzomyia longipalpis TaxID=7200 RepID=UPI002483490B|nr:gastrula zinc finger protein xFG20-1-like isoform X2 [Lutzomyia longipalpis]
MISTGRVIHYAEAKKCRICEVRTNLMDSWMEEFRYIHRKLKVVTDYEEKYKNWLRYICICCKSQLDDFWDFKIRCDNAYRKFVEATAPSSSSSTTDDDLRDNFVVNNEEIADVCERIKTEQETVQYEEINTVALPGENATRRGRPNPSSSSTIKETQKHKSGQKKKNEDSSSYITQIHNFKEVRVLLPRISQKDAREGEKGGTSRQRLMLTKSIDRNEVLPKRPKSRSERSVKKMTERHSLMAERYLCIHCGYQFSRKTTLRQHMEKHLKKRREQRRKTTSEDVQSNPPNTSSASPSMNNEQQLRLTCGYCNEKFIWFTEYKNHLIAHSKKRVRPSALKEHKTQEQAIRGVVYCTYCKKEFYNRGLCKIHSRTCKKNDNRTEKENVSSTPLRHIETIFLPEEETHTENQDITSLDVKVEMITSDHTDENTIKENQTLEREKNITPMYAEMDEAESENYSDRDNDEISVEENPLLEEENGNGEKIKEEEIPQPKPFQCYKCEFKSSRKSVLSQHMQNHLMEQQVLLEERIFKTIERNIQQHSTNDEDQLKFTCGYCKEKFIWFTDYKTHMELHAQKRIHSSKKKKKKTNAHSRSYEKSQAVRKIHHCTYCRRRFQNGGLCKIHIRTCAKNFRSPEKATVTSLRGKKDKNLDAKRMKTWRTLKEWMLDRKINQIMTVM